MQSANATNSSSDRQALQAEVDQLVSEIDRVAAETNFNGVRLLDGSFQQQNFQVGANAGETISVDSVASSRASDLGQRTEATVTGGAITAGGISGLDINGTSISSASDARALATAINSSGADVTATALANEVDGTDITGNAAATDAGEITINGVTTSSITLSADEATNLSLVADAINDISAATGVSASLTGTVSDGVELTASDGRKRCHRF